MERICITIEGGLILHGDILVSGIFRIVFAALFPRKKVTLFLFRFKIKCYHKNTLSSGRDIIFRCQFHTGAVDDYGLVLDKSDLDDACRGMVVLPCCTKSHGNATEIKSLERPVVVSTSRPLFTPEKRLGDY